VSLCEFYEGQEVKKKIGRNDKKRWLTAYLFILPAAIFWTYWFFIPACESFGLSFFEYNYVMPLNNHFVGLNNYIKLFSDNNFLRAIQHSLTIVAVAVPIQTIISLLMALIINKNFKGRGFFRTLFYSPYVISSLAVATVFMYLFAQNQPLTNLFSKLFGMENSAWAVNVRYALILVILMYVWQQVGFYMVMYLSGLQTIPGEINESAKIDGASGFQIFWYITRPLLKPTTFLVITYGVISAFQIFDQISAVAGTGVLGTPGGGHLIQL
jgi:multiple sugar transport system permease protein